MVEYPLKFKAAVLERINDPLVVDEVTFDGPLKTGQVLVRIYYSGICGKQIEEITGAAGKDLFLPHMLGHEGAGVVMDVGPGVRKVSPGDHVVLQWMKGSGIDAETPYYTRFGKRVNAGWITTFNEYGVISENRITPVPKGTDFKTACLLGCAITTGVGVIVNEARVQPGDSIAVFGCGGVGLCAVQGARLARANPVIVIDKNAESMELASSFGATHAINSSDNVIEKVNQFTNGKGAKFVIIAAADPRLMETAVGSSAVPGHVFFVAVPPAGAKVTVDALDIHRQRTLSGSCGGGITPDKDILKYLRLNEDGCLELESLITNTVSLDDINDGISAMMKGRPGRCVVKLGSDKTDLE